MNDQRPTRWPWSADSSRKAGSPGASARSFRNAETGVSQSSTKLCRSGIRLWVRAKAGASSRPGSRRSGEALTLSPGAAPGALGATAIEHPLRVDERPFPAAQEHQQVVEHVCRLLVHALGRLLPRGPGDLLGLLHHLLADPLRVVEQL